MEEIINAVSSGCCVLFAGSGICRDAQLPNWTELISQTISILFSKKLITPEDKKYFESEASDPTKIPIVFDLIINKVKREKLIPEIRKILSTDKSSKVIHLLNSLNFRGVVTTNYDKLTFSNYY